MSYVLMYNWFVIYFKFFIIYIISVWFDKLFGLRINKCKFIFMCIFMLKKNDNVFGMDGKLVIKIDIFFL